MSFYDILRLSLRNLREARLRATLTSMGVIVGVAVIVTMVSFGLGLQRNLLSRFKALDLFNEIRVFGKNVFAMAVSGVDPKLKRDTNPGDRRGPALRPDKSPTRILDDAAIAEIEKIPGVAYVEPDIGFTAFVRSNGRVLPLSVAGVSVPTLSSRFKDFAAGKMLIQPDGDEVIVGEVFTETFGFQKPEDAVGQTMEFLTTPDKKDSGSPSARAAGDEEQSGLSFFGIPLEDENNDAGENTVVARTFRISGVLKAEPKDQGPAGLMSNASIYIPVHAAHEWASKHPNPMGEVALALARQSGQLKQSESEGYFSAVIRVSDPVVLTEVRKRLTEMGFGSFSIVDELEKSSFIDSAY